MHSNSMQAVDKVLSVKRMQVSRGCICLAEMTAAYLHTYAQDVLMFKGSKH